MWITCLWYHVYQFHQKKGKWGILTFHNTIWNAAIVVKLDMYRMNWIVLWGEPLRWIYVPSVILLNYTGKKDSSNIWMKLYFTHKHNISEYHFIQRWVMELKRRNNVKVNYVPIFIPRSYFMANSFYSEYKMVYTSTMIQC